MAKFQEYKPSEYRKPSEKALLTALHGAVVILTPDGHNVVLSPAAARDIGKNLIQLAMLADGIVNKTPNTN